MQSAPQRSPLVGLGNGHSVQNEHEQPSDKKWWRQTKLILGSTALRNEDPIGLQLVPSGKPKLVQWYVCDQVRDPRSQEAKPVLLTILFLGPICKVTTAATRGLSHYRHLPTTAGRKKFRAQEKNTLSATNWKTPPITRLLHTDPVRSSASVDITLTTQERRVPDSKGALGPRSYFGNGLFS